MIELVLYTSENCGLCDRAKHALARAGAAYDEVLVADDHPYRLRTPVLESGGTVVAEGIIGDPELRKALRPHST
jgi:glutaredoxin